MTEIRVQRRREKGWRMPENTVYVGRPSRWGNPWPLSIYRRDFGYYFKTDAELRAMHIGEYRAWITGQFDRMEDVGWMTLPVKPDLAPLRGRNLACWCPLDQPCHADVLLELANA